MLPGRKDVNQTVISGVEQDDVELDGVELDGVEWDGVYLAQGPHCKRQEARGDVVGALHITIVLLNWVI